MRAVRSKASARLAGYLLLVATGLSCGGGGDSPTQPGGGGTLAKSITVSPNGGTVIAGQTMSFTAQAKDADGNPLSQTLTWGVSDSSVATVAAGVVTGRKPGSVLLSATNGVVTGGVTVTVIAAVAKVDLTPSPDSIIITQTSQLTATPRDASGASITGRTVTYTSSNDAVASVSASGLVTAKTLGTATVTATVDGTAGTATIVVRAIPVSTIAITPLAGALAIGDAVTLTATTKDSTGTILAGRAIAWSSSNTSVGDVTPTGAFTAKAGGSTTITATSEGKSATLVVTVLQSTPVASIVVASPSANVAAGRTIQLTDTTKAANGQPLTGRAVTWTTSDATKATVSATGLVTAVSAGSVTITATSEGQSGSAALSVADLTPPQVVGLSISPVSVDVSTQAQIVTFAATMKDAGGAGVQRVNFIISGPSGGTGNTCSGIAPEPGGTSFDGIYKCSITVPVGAPTGYWGLSIVALDQALNHVSVDSTTLAANGLPTKFTVVDANPDHTPPTLGQLNFTPTAVDVSTAAQTITVAAQLADAGSGVSRFDFSITAPNGVSSAGCSAFAPASGTAASGTWGCQFAVPAGAQPGQWSIKAAAVDASYNTTVILPPDKITVTNSAPDLTPPDISSLTITPQTVDVSYGAQVVTVAAHLTDAGSGVSGFTFTALAPDNSTVACSASQPDSGTTADGTWSCRFTIPHGIALGDWLATVQIGDAALNQRQLGSTDLATKGLPTKFTVVSNTP